MIPDPTWKTGERIDEEPLDLNGYPSIKVTETRHEIMKRLGLVGIKAMSHKQRKLKGEMMARTDTRTLVILLNGLDNDWSHWSETYDRNEKQYVGRRIMGNDSKLKHEIMEVKYAIKALEQMRDSAVVFIDEAKDFMELVDIEEKKDAS